MNTKEAPLPTEMFDFLVEPVKHFGWNPVNIRVQPVAAITDSFELSGFKR